MDRVYNTVFKIDMPPKSYTLFGGYTISYSLFYW